jgi:hypothetical protein
VRFDYVTVGHVTLDLIADERSRILARRPGGGAFYSALQASRLGLRTLIVTRGVPLEIEQLLEPYRGELELEIQPAAKTTALQTQGDGLGRRQRVLAWAGPIEAPTLDTSILHLAPVARETPARWRGSADFVGLTPQGLAREWSDCDGEIALSAPDADALPSRCDAIVISEIERPSCAELISRAARQGTVVAVTAGDRPTTVILPAGEPLQVPAPDTPQASEDVGAGDVFAAAFFIALHDGRAAAAAAAFATAAAALRIQRAGTKGIAGRTAIERSTGPVPDTG